MGQASTSDAASVSVVIPVYNRIEYLGQTIESVLGQTYRDFEVIIIDDGSTEDVAGFVRRYQDERIRFVRQENRGNAAARNHGFRLSRGQFIAFLDSDDAWKPEMLEQCVERLTQADDVGVVYARWIDVDARGEPIQPQPQHKALRGNPLVDLVMGVPIFPSAAVIRRPWLERCGGFDEALDDWDLWLRLALAGCQFACIETPLVLYRRHGGSFSHQLERRREVHFGTLDKLFSQPDLPDAIRALQSKAYARQHLSFGLMALGQGLAAMARQDLSQAIILWPTLLTEEAFYFELASALQPLGYKGSATLDIPESTRAATQAIDWLFERDDVRELSPISYREARARAYLALGRLAYAAAENYAAARHLLLHSLRLWPPLLWQSEAGAYLLRSLAGPRVMDQLRRWRLRAQEANRV
ncbi:MAG: hypothetical protein Kow0047_11630 [Anaerolineae bacterium]